MVDYLDHMVRLVLGGQLEETSAEVKIKSVDTKFKNLLTQLAQEQISVEPNDPNGTGLVRIIEQLKTTLDNTRKSDSALRGSSPNSRTTSKKPPP